MVSTCAAQPSEGIWHLVSYSLNIFFPMSSYPLQAAGTDIPLSVLHCWLKLSLPSVRWSSLLCGVPI